MNSRRSFFSQIGIAATGASATLATVGLANGQNGNRNGCQAPQHFRQTDTFYVFSPCTNEYVRFTVDIKHSVQTCLQADGSASFRIQTKLHGSGYGIDVFTDTSTGTNYILHSNDKIRIVSGPFGSGECVPFSERRTLREKVISKGGSPNSFLLIHSTFSTDSSCHMNFEQKYEFECRG
jgi:hypothetical protein